MILTIRKLVPFTRLVGSWMCLGCVA